jgi:hypothetical protein
MVERQVVVSLALIALVLTSGCTSFIQGEQPLRLTATPAGVPDQTLEQTGYAQQRASTLPYNRSFDLFGWKRQVEFTNHLRVYARSESVSGDISLFNDTNATANDAIAVESATFTVLSTPGETIARSQLNPVANESHRRLLDRFRSVVGPLEDVQRENETPVTMLGQETELTTFVAERRATDGGNAREVVVHVARVTDDDNVVVAIGSHPRSMTEEPATVRTLVENVEFES